MAYEKLLRQQITLYTKSGLNKFGRETLSSGSVKYARVEPSGKTTFLPNGDTITIDLNIFLLPSVTINEGDKITYSNVNYKVFGVAPIHDGNGTLHHKEVQCIKWV